MRWEDKQGGDSGAWLWQLHGTPPAHRLPAAAQPSRNFPSREALPSCPLPSSAGHQPVWQPPNSEGIRVSLTVRTVHTALLVVGDSQEMLGVTAGTAQDAPRVPPVSRTFPTVQSKGQPEHRIAGSSSHS